MNTFRTQHCAYCKQIIIRERELFIYSRVIFVAAQQLTIFRSLSRVSCIYWQHKGQFAMKVSFYAGNFPVVMEVNLCRLSGDGKQRSPAVCVQNNNWPRDKGMIQ